MRVKLLQKFTTKLKSQNIDTPFMSMKELAGRLNRSEGAAQSVERQDFEGNSGEGPDVIFEVL
jgi:hypothetical protein